jgi:amino acid transporter
MPDDSSSPAAPTPGPAPEPPREGEPAPAEEPPPQEQDPAEKPDWRHWLLGAPRDIGDPHTYHSISLIALLAWVGLGADGLSSSAYGPDEAFRALGSHTYLAVALALATALTVLVISVAYSQIIKRFPFGGGGYIVASQLLGPKVGLVSGAALLVDYVLTIAVSIASGADQVFSVLPGGMAAFKVETEVVVIVILLLMNLRGVKESVTTLAPIFALFLLTHAILVIGGIGHHLGDVPRVAGEVHRGFQTGFASLGFVGMFALFLRAYSMGGGTYTGIEAVSNGLQIMREPKVQTAQRTMTYMSISLAATAGGILICYLLFNVAPLPGKTLNAVLLDRFAGGWHLAGMPLGQAFVVITLCAEAALLFVAAQAGFIDGPRVMANMASDSWLPHRFASLSDRLTMQNGVLLIGAAAIAVLVYTRGDITALVTMYSINVFLTFSLSQLAMLRYWKSRGGDVGRKRGLSIHGVAFAMCGGILLGTVYEKGAQGGWVTIVATGLLVALCMRIKRHYERVHDNLKALDDIKDTLPEVAPGFIGAPDPKANTAVLLVSSYSGLGIHSLLSVIQTFPGQYKNVIFVSIGVIDSATMKGVEEVDLVAAHTKAELEKYVDLAHRLGLAADYRTALGTEVVDTAEELCRKIAREFRRPVFFTSKLVFRDERWYQRLLHNETPYQMQRRFQFAGLTMVVLPVRILATTTKKKAA